jgi:protein SCO1/2
MTSRAQPGRRRSPFRLPALAGLSALVLVASPPALAHDHDMEKGEGHEHQMDMGEGHQHHMDMDMGESPAPGSKPIQSMREYTVPSVRLLREDGKSVSLPQEMDDGRPVVLNFIYTTCTDICPLMSGVLSQFEHELGKDAGKVHLMSISIDPEQDTPARLTEYARRFHAGPEWQHYTGTLDDSVAAQRAFDVYRGSKMTHSAVTLMRAAPGKPWLRIEGFVTPADLVRDYRELVASR